MTEEDVSDWCCELVDATAPRPSFDDCMDAIPLLDALADLPHGTRVLVRCDTNVAFASGGCIENDSRLISVLETLQWGRERGWVQIVHGHIGNNGQQSLRPVAAHLGQLLGCSVGFLEDWMDDQSGEVHGSTGEKLSTLAPGNVVMLENARRYPLETCLWRPRPASLAPLVSRLTRYVRTVRERLATVHVNEGFAASNCDLSSAVVPLAMNRIALGRHVARELCGPVRLARQAEVVIFSGAKFNKLDDLEGIVRRGQVRLVVSGGLLALPLLKADADLAGRTFEMGRADEVPSERCEQARRILTEMRRRQIEIQLPVDFILEDGSVVERIPAGAAQRDLGPRTLELFALRLKQFAFQRPGATIFHNGVLGQFERPEFAAGTRRFLAMLKDMYAAGLQVYVGGGEGGTAIEQLGDPTSVTHCFTAGTTILKALGTNPIPYVWALYRAATRTRRAEATHAV